MAGFAGTSNCLAAKLFGMTPVGTMAHSFVQAHDSEAEAFGAFIQTYKDLSILIVDTHEPVEGIRKAAEAAKAYNESDSIKIKGIRIDGGDLAALSRFARKHFDDHQVPFMKIFVSGNLNEFVIRQLIETNAPIDGFGAGTWFATSPFAPYVDSAYKLIEYSGKPRHKSSPGKATYPGRKAILRKGNGPFEKDTVCPFGAKEDLLRTFSGPEPMAVIRKRLAGDLAALDESVKRLQDPKPYPVEFAL
jgi:nicotinate phosphoribosyltransferase